MHGTKQKNNEETKNIKQRCSGQAIRMELYMAQLASVYNRHQSRHLVSWPEYDYIIPGHSTYTAWSVLRDWWDDRHCTAAGHRADLAAVAGTSNTYINIQRQKHIQFLAFLSGITSCWNWIASPKRKVRVIGSGSYTKGNSKHQPGKIMQRPTEIQLWFQRENWRIMKFHLWWQRNNAHSAFGWNCYGGRPKVTKS